MLTRITNFADAYALVPGWQDDARPPRVIAPLQHIFDPVISAADFYGQSQQWGDLPVRAGGFSVAPRIVFDHIPVLPANLAEAMLYHLQLRLIEGVIVIHHTFPALPFGQVGLDGEVTLLPA